MIIASFAEILSIGAVLPFLGVLTAPISVFKHPAAQPFIELLGINSPDQLLFPLTVVFCLAALIVGAMRLLLLWANTRLTYAAGADLSISIYRRTLYQSYAIHVARNSSEIINGITSKVGSAIGIIRHIFNLLGSFVVLIAILIALVAVDPIIAMVAFSGFGLIYIFIIRFTRTRLLRNSQQVALESTNLIKSLQEGLGGIRDVLIDGSQNAYCQIYLNSDLPLRRAQSSSIFISTSPRYGMEAMGMVLIATLAYFLAQQPDGITKAIPILGALAVGAQRFLPVLQQAYAAWTGIRGSQISFQDALDLLDQPLPDYANQQAAKPLPFEKYLSLNQLSFRYSDETPWVLKNLDLCITKGSRVGFIGTTGSGKSTLLDIVMGLLQTTEGSFEVDGTPITMGNHRAWQAHIAHVPQAIFLADSTIEENIAFGVPKKMIDHERVRQSAQQAQIADIIETWPKQYLTFVGERGIRLSGGQRQRIGIARALYKQADVIVLDEATSALDNETELEVMQAIEGLSNGLTILIIAHRLSTLKNCTQIIELGGGRIKRAGTYQNIVSDISDAGNTSVEKDQ
jgi:ATP-binding cassette subfamily B protein